MLACCYREGQEVEQVIISEQVFIAEPEFEFAPAPAVEPLPSPAAAGGTLVIGLERSGTVADLGLILDSTNEELVIIQGISEGLVRNYNKTCPARKAIKIYDWIISLNGTRGSLPEFRKLLESLKVENTLTIEVVQPTETSVLLKKAGVLGITLNYKTASVGLLVKGINDGTLNEWNKAHPDTPIKPGDLIVAVNKVTYNAVDLLKKLKESGSLDITVMRYVL
ncbi:unnamed protein product [Polarella glacialis]|uniref:PDZ domain-containing protein n=1 Tax=Polarella glacialis TaxID=89957 RepID=A0A813LY70_POLGL|nr:unnamed protein product [Polarella glacialis]CAE8741363.1 unnamed protein product [Polarella glacialis]